MKNLKKTILIFWIFCINIQAQNDPNLIFRELYSAHENNKIENKINELVRDPEFEIDATDQDGNTALIISAKYGYYTIAKHLLMAGANINHKNKYRHTALLTAQKHHHLDLIKLLSEEVPEPFHLQPILEFTEDCNKQLRDAIRAENKRLIGKLLYEPHGIQNINQTNPEGLTPLMIATKIKSSSSIIRHLLACGASMYIKDNNGNSAFDWAKINNNNPALELLNRRRYEQSELIDNISTKTNTQAWYKYFKEIVQANSPNIIKAAVFDNDDNLFITKQIIKQNPSSVLTEGPFATTPLMIAAALGKVKMASLLIYSGAEAREKDIYSRTALIYSQQ